ncbi:MAG TPA: class I SAM-dependent methyltransferase [Fibrobacteraceae bacterium]|nr:class I SAM-dependent methyltransferase [Fibrobacteraceae bacterium]
MIPKDSSQCGKWDDFYVENPTLPYDGWLELHLSRFPAGKDFVLDLGCGNGVNLPFLVRHAKKVWACDKSREAIRIVQRNFSVEAILLDMRQGLPYPDRQFDRIVADLSLHYFSLVETRKIAGEMARVLKNDGLVLARLNSVRDVLHGSGVGKEIESNFYENEGYRKHFFDEDEIQNCFAQSFEVRQAEEKLSYRYGEEKILWEVVMRVRR